MEKIQKIKELCIYKKFRYMHYFPICERKESFRILSIVEKSEPLELEKLTLSCTEFCTYLKVSEKFFINMVNNYNGQVEGICLRADQFSNKSIDLRYTFFNTFEDMSNFLDHIHSIMTINCLNTED